MGNWPGDRAAKSDKLLTVGNTVATLDELYIWLSNITTIEYIRNTLKRAEKVLEEADVLAEKGALPEGLRSFIILLTIQANLYPFNYSGKTDPQGFYVGRDRYGSNVIIGGADVNEYCAVDQRLPATVHLGGQGSHVLEIWI